MNWVKLPPLGDQIEIAGRIVADLYQIDVKTATRIVEIGIASGDITKEDLAEHILDNMKKQIKNQKKEKKEVFKS